MNPLERFAIKNLREFVRNAENDGLCHSGYDIDEDMQTLVIEIVKTFISNYEKADGE